MYNVVASEQSLTASGSTNWLALILLLDHPHPFSSLCSLSLLCLGFSVNPSVWIWVINPSFKTPHLFRFYKIWRLFWRRVPGLRHHRKGQIKVPVVLLTNSDEMTYPRVSLKWQDILIVKPCFKLQSLFWSITSLFLQHYCQLSLILVLVNRV